MAQIKSEHMITAKQAKFIMIGSMVGTGILSLPRVASKEVGQDGWVSIILGAIIPCIAINMINSLYEKYPGYTFYELVYHLAGKVFGSIIFIIYIAYFTFGAGTILRIFVEAITMFALARTPTVVKIVLLLIPCTYLSISGMKVIGRVEEFIFYITLPLLLFPIPALVEHAQPLNFLPAFTYKASKYFSAAFSTTFSYQGYELLLIYYPFITNKENARGETLSGLFITFLIYLYTVVDDIMIFGAILTQNYAWPTISLLSTAKVAIFERLEFLFLVAWTAVSFRPITNTYFCGGYAFSEIFNMKEYKNAIYILAPIMIIIGIIPKSIFEAQKYAEFVGSTSLITGIAIPLLLYLLSFIPSKKMNKSQSTNSKG